MLLFLQNMTMVELLKWLSHGSVYVNVIRKSNNSANNWSHGIPTKYLGVGGFIVSTVSGFDPP